MVDTEALTDGLIAHYACNTRRYRRCLSGMVDALGRDDLVGVVHCKRLSARLSQEVLSLRTGIHRNYDYFADGQWLAPHHFMQLIRASQGGGK